MAKTRSRPTDNPFLTRYGLKPDGGWAERAAADIAAMPAPQQALWFALFDHLARASPRPSGKGLQDAQSTTEAACLHEPPDYTPDGVENRLGLHEPGTEQFASGILNAAPPDDWFATLSGLFDKIGHDAASGRAASWIAAATKTSAGVLNRPGPNREILRALLWSTLKLHTPACTDALRQLAAYCTQHNATQATTIALVLAATATEDSLAALQLLAQGAKRPTPRGRYLRGAAHVAARIGLSPDEAAERFVPTYDLDAAGSRQVAFGAAASASLSLSGNDAFIEWRNPAGKIIKSIPAAARKEHGDDIADLKADAKAIEKMLLAQRDRLDRLMPLRRSWKFDQFKAWYIDHPLVGHLARRLIWVIDQTPSLFINGTPQDITGKPVRASAASAVTVWHPIDYPAQDVLAWRQRLSALQITQPFKQAHREIYLLTDAERTTRTYSNRFAAHILRQHQFAALARARGWDYRLLGSWDGGDTTSATRPVPGADPTQPLHASYWLTGGGEEATDAGILLHVATDQLRFFRTPGGEPIPLDQVPPLLLSETLRDVDLFVGVASVGNDPAWRDGGPARNRDYWNTYSFGDLAESAKTRKAALQQLLPRLKIALRASITDKFLVIKGDLRTYKIHLGSGNILMDPNDQYLCIVPDRSSMKESTGDLFLPFEGDTTLAVILSKALLLADDKNITDQTITRQIKQR